MLYDSITACRVSCVIFSLSSNSFLLLGAAGLTSSQVSSVFGIGTGPIAFNYIRCAGTEARLMDCPTISSRSCNHNEDVGVRCLRRTGNGY